MSNEEIAGPIKEEQCTTPDFSGSTKRDDGPDGNDERTATSILDPIGHAGSSNNLTFKMPDLNIKNLMPLPQSATDSVQPKKFGQFNNV